MTTFPYFVAFLFSATVLLSIYLFYRASGSKSVLIFVIIWTFFQSLIAIKGDYIDTWDTPPKIMQFGVFPTLIIMLIMFISKKGRKIIDGFELKNLTRFHAIRIPVELCLSLLFHFGLVSAYMTFEGTNFDIISGLSAIPVAILAFKKGINKKLLIIWNAICLLLLLNVVITAVFCLPSNFQLLAFDQPNIAVVYFPFSLLPTVVVPLVFFGHLIAFRHLMKKA